jgi:hypothetical protein
MEAESLRELDLTGEFSPERTGNLDLGYMYSRKSPGFLRKSSVLELAKPVLI